LYRDQAKSPFIVIRAIMMEFLIMLGGSVSIQNQFT
jgi:hypothetical protein